MDNQSASASSSIAKLKALLGIRTLSESECLYVLVLIRKEIEAMPASVASRYSYVKLFCDWALHIAIDRSRAGSKLVASVHEAVIQVKHSPTAQVVTQISSSLLEPFRTEMANFLQGKFLPTTIVSDHAGWRMFLGHVLEIIWSSPVLLLDQDQQTVQSTPLKEGMWATAIGIVKINYDKHLDVNSTSTNETYCLQILTSDTTRIVVPVTPAI